MVVWSGGASRVARGTAGLLALVGSLTTSCGGRSSLFVFGSGDGEGGTSPGLAGSGATGGAWTGGLGGLGTGGSAGGVVSGGGSGVSSAGAGGFARCGDAKRDEGEACDDANRVSGDGCTSVCRVEPGATCVEGHACVFSVCGNGVLEFGEECDAGASNGVFYGDRSGCTRFCSSEPDCSSGACSARCGDGHIDASESCDDGNRFDGDGCSATCTIEPGFYCSGEPMPDAEPCADGETLCVRMGIRYRDFEPLSDAAPGGHADFYSLGVDREGDKLACVPDSSARPRSMNGDCYGHDSTSLCLDLIEPGLDANGRPVARPPSGCACRFTDWTDSGLLTGRPGVQVCTDAEGRPHEWVEETVTSIASPDSFAAWFAPSDYSVEQRSTLELRADGFGYRYSSGPSVDEELHAIFMGHATTVSGGFFPLEASGSARVCNLFPYFLPELALDCSAGPGQVLTDQWDPRGSDTPGVEGLGGRVTPVQGVARNFHFTSEAHVLYRYKGAGTITFYGDDDVWVFLNGHLVLDLGGTHARLRGTVRLDGPRVSSMIEVQDATTLGFTTVAHSVLGDIGIEAQERYDLAIFHANRSPRDSNYEFAFDPAADNLSVCSPSCGNGIVTITEECDLGPNNSTEGYGACTTSCRIGPYCGDGVVQAEFGEECDLGEGNHSSCGDCRINLR